MTRITDAMMSRSLLRDLSSLEERLRTSQQRAASGKELTRPSDDPFRTGRAVALRGELDEIRQHQRNVREAASWQEVTDGALSRVSDITRRAIELAIQGASGTASPAAREALATEIDQLAAAAKQEVNTTYDGRYVFAGTTSRVRPFVEGDDVYRGDDGVMARQIGPGVSIQVNVSGRDVLLDGGSGDGLLDVLRAAAGHLRSGTPADLELLRTSDLGRLNGVVDDLAGIRARVGATANRLEVAGSRLVLGEETALRLLSDVEDADIAKTMIDLTTQRTAYEAALRAGAQIVQPSLLDFLR